MSEIILLSNARLSFPHLIDPQESVAEDGTKTYKYNASFIVEPSNPGYAELMRQYSTLAATKWQDRAQGVMNIINGDRKLRSYGAGAEKIDKKTFKPYLGYEGMNHVSANSKDRPQMIQADGKAADASNTMLYQALARKLYAGCYVNVALKPWLQDNKKHGYGARCELVAIQFSKDGEAFGESVPDVTGKFGVVGQVESPAPAAPAMPDFMKG